MSEYDFRQTKNIIFASVIIFSIRQWQKLDTYSRLITMTHTRPGVRELAFCIEMCRIKVVRLISIHDRIDSCNELFKETTAAEVLEMIGALPEEIAALRKSSSQIMLFQKNIKSPAKTVKALSRTERERTIVDMYNAGYSMDDIANVSGFSSMSSIFRILNKYNVNLNRGRTKGPRWKKGTEETE